MTPSARKTFWWYALAASMGGTSFFFYICLLESFPPKEMLGVYLWPLTSILIMIASILALRRCYRDEPGAFSGFWQLSIVDLYAVIFFAALWMAIWRSVSPNDFVSHGIAVSLFMGFALTFCLLLSARKGYPESREKIPFAIGLLLKTLGWLALGAIILLCSYWILYRYDLHRLAEILGYCMFVHSDGWHSLRVLNPVRIGLLFLPVGMALCWLIEKRRRVLP